VKERRGAFGRTVGMVTGSLASAARRGQAAGATRVVIYDAAGHATLLRPETPEHAAIAEPAEALLELVRDVWSPARVEDEEGSEPG
jgi:hypothetical protein